MKRGVAYAMLGSMIALGAATAHLNHSPPPEQTMRQRSQDYSVLEEGPTQSPSLNFTPASPADTQSPAPGPPVCISDSQFEDVIAAVRHSTVLIDTGEGLGSGVIIAHRNGETWVLTNRHVVEAEGAGPDRTPRAAEDVVVHNDGSEAKAVRIMIAPEGIDLALVIVKGDIGPDARLANATLRRGTSVVAVGSPLGIEDSAARGIVSNFVERTSGGGFRFTAIQTDAAINPGNSGGGLFLAGTGELLGITTFKLRISPFETAEGMAFVIPVDMISRFPLQTWRELPMPAPSHSEPDAGTGTPTPSPH